MFLINKRVAAALAAACLFLPLGPACGGSTGGLRISPADSPGSYKSLGRTDIYVEIQGTGNRASEVSIPISERTSFWFLPGSLRLARWDAKERSLIVLPDSRFERKTGTLSGVVDTDGIYTALGLSRVDRILAAQLQICRGKSERTVWPGCEVMLCPPPEMDSLGVGWSDSLGIFSKEVERMFGPTCENCLHTWIPGAFPECHLIPGAVDTAEVFETKPYDFDGDGLDNKTEILLGTDPQDEDTDDDGLGDGVEVALGTDPLLKDTDEDGLWDGWEVNGYDADGDGTPEVNLSGMGTDPLRKDLLVEVDWMFEDENGNGQEESGELSFRPIPAALDNVVQKFAEAPVDNPGGSPGINLIVNLSNGLPEVRFNQSHSDSMLFFLKSADEVEFTSRYYAIKQQHMEPHMASISRYCVWIRRFKTRTAGYAEFPPGPSDDFVVSLGDMDPPNGTQGQQQGTFMHELGHTLGLYHSGDEPPLGQNLNHEPNYPSVMNYLHMFSGVQGKLSYDERAEADRYDPFTGDYIGICFAGAPDCNQYRKYRLCFTPDSACVYTYSLGDLEPVNENQLSEQEGIKGISGPVDWNFNGNIDSGLVGADLQGDNITGAQTDHNDWSHLDIPFW